MAIENPSRNPFLGIYQRTQGGQASNVGMGQPQDFLSSEEVIGRPDAQNTAQRSNASSKGLKDAYDAVASGSELIPMKQRQLSPREQVDEHQKRFVEFTKKLNIGTKSNPFTGAKKAAFDAAVAGRQLTPEQEAIVNQNFAEFQAAQSAMMGYESRELMPWRGGSSGAGGKQTRSSTSTISHEYDLSKPMKPGGAAPWFGFSTGKETQQQAASSLSQEEEARYSKIFQK
jgi:hypothetical protein